MGKARDIYLSYSYAWGLQGDAGRRVMARKIRAGAPILLSDQHAFTFPCAHGWASPGGAWRPRIRLPLVAAIRHGGRNSTHRRTAEGKRVPGRDAARFANRRERR